MRISTDSENKDEVLKSDQLKHEENFENQLENNHQNCFISE